MHVAIFMNNFNGGGGERATVMIANGLASLGHEVTVIVVSEHGPCRELMLPAIKVLPLGTGRAVWSLPSLVRALRKTRPDVLLTAMVIANVLSAMAGLILRKLPIIAVEHGNMNEVYHADKAHLAARIGYHIAPWVYGRLDRIYCVDQSTLLSVAAFTRRHDLKLVTMPNPVIRADADHDIALDPAHPWMDGSIPVFLNIGRMADQKNQRLLIDAFAKVVALRSARLIILGEGPLRRDLEAQVAALGLQGHVDMPGFRNPFPFLARANTFVLSSNWEALPTVIIEAMYCGCQVVATKASMGTIELLGYGKLGCIVEHLTPDCLAESMLASLDESVDPDLLRRQGSRYRIEAVAKQYEKDIERLLAEERHTPNGGRA